AFQVDPVVIYGIRWRRCATRDEALGTAKRIGSIAVLGTGQMDDDALGGAAAARPFQLALAALRGAQGQRPIAEDRLGRIAEGLELEFATHAKRAVDPAHEDAARLVGHALRGHAMRGPDIRRPERP